MEPAFFGINALRALGLLLIVLSPVVLIDSFLRFSLEGFGTPSPVAPPQTLVIDGFYRYVRNPMYVALITLIFGQALLLGNTALLAYALLVWLATHAFIVFYEEPKLRKTYGAAYDAYRSHVSRWFPWRKQ